MSKYAISNKGIEALEQLKGNLISARNDIGIASEALFEYVSGLENGMGIYYKEILVLIKSILNTLALASEGDDGIDALIKQFIPKHIRYIEEMIAMGLGDGEPYQKVKKLWCDE